jgi:hypothetical protein
MSDAQAQPPATSQRQAGLDSDRRGLNGQSSLLVDDLNRVIRAAPPVEVTRRRTRFMQWFLMPDKDGSWFDTEARVHANGSIEYVRVPGRATRWTAGFLAGLLVAGVAVPGPVIVAKWLVAGSAETNAERLGWRPVALPELYRNLSAVKNATREAIENPALPRPERAAAVEALVRSLAYFRKWEELANLDRRYVRLAPDVAPAVVAAAWRANRETAPRVVRDLIGALAPGPLEVPSLGYVSLLILDERWNEVDRTLSTRRALLAQKNPPIADPDGLLLRIAATHMRPDAEFRAAGVDAPSERYRQLEALWFEYSLTKGSDPFLYGLWLHADGRPEAAINEYDRLAGKDDRALLGSIFARAELARYNIKWLDAAQALAKGPGRQRLRSGAAVESLLGDLRSALTNRSVNTSAGPMRILGQRAKPLATVPVHAPPQLIGYLGTNTLEPTSVGNWPFWSIDGEVQQRLHDEGANPG